MESESTIDMADPIVTPGPRAAMRALHPDLFPDSTSSSAPTLSKTVFEYHLDTLTSRKQEYEFEHFGRKLAEQELCPNLRPQTGPTGGGDSKVDTETYPVAEELAERWWTGNPAAGKERWAFAFSAKKAWKPKVDKDVLNILATGRAYDRIYFLSNQFISDKKRAAAEDELSKHGTPVHILDRTWLVEKVFDNGHLPLALATLQIEPETRPIQKIGPRDAQRTADLEILDRQIADPGNFAGADYQLAEACLDAAVLARSLGRPRAEVDGRFAQAERIARKISYRQQLLRIAYLRAWTAFWWFEDFAEFYKYYLGVEELAIEDERASDLERLTTLWHLLAGERQKPSHGLDIDQDLRLRHLTDALEKAIADGSRPNNALQARTLLWQVKTFLAFTTDDNKALSTQFGALRSIIADSADHGAFSVVQLARIVKEVGNVVDDPAFDRAYEDLVDAVRRRQSDGEAGKAYNTRGLQKLKQGRPYEAIKWFGKAEGILPHTDAHRSDTNIALVGASHAYEDAGLLWAARNKALVAAERSLASFVSDGEMARAALPCLMRLADLELLLGRVPQTLQAMLLSSFVERHLNLPEERATLISEERHIQEAILGIHMLNLTPDALRESTRLPDAFERLGLNNARLALLWALGQFEPIAEEGYFENETVEHQIPSFETWQDQPVGEEISRTPLLIASNTVRLTSIVLGARIVAETPSSALGQALAESVLGAFEAFMATSDESDVIPHREETLIVLRGDLRPGEAIKMRQILETGAYEIDYPSEIRFGTAADIRAHMRWLRDTVATLASHIFIVRDPEAWLSRLGGNEDAFSRSISLGDMLTLGRNIFGDASQVTLSSWIDPEDKDYPLLRTEQWRKRSYAASEEVELAPPSFGEGDPPDEMFDRSTARHDQRAVLSPIEIGLWNAAGWTATFFGHYPGKPPIFGLGFKNEPAAAAILDGWIRRWGNRDEKEELRVAIITGISRRNPTHYVVSIGPNMTRPRDGQKYFSIVMRRCRMTPKTTVNLDMFLKQYAEYGAYFLTTSGMYGSEEIDPRRLLLKAQLDVKAAWQIGPNDPDLSAIEDDDDPYIPPGEPDPPLKRAFAWQKEMRARPR